MRQREGEWVKIHEGLLCLIQLQMKSVCSVNSICLRRRLVDVVITPPPTALLALHLPPPLPLSVLLFLFLVMVMLPLLLQGYQAQAEAQRPVPSSSKRNLHKMAAFPQE